MKNKFYLLKVFIILIITFSSIITILDKKNASAEIIPLDTNKKFIKVEIKKVLDSIKEEFNTQKIDSIIKDWVTITDSLLLRNLGNINFEDIDANIEYSDDSLGHKSIEIQIKGIPTDSSKESIKKIEIRIYDNKDSNKIQNKSQEKNLNDSSIFNSNDNSYEKYEDLLYNFIMNNSLMRLLKLLGQPQRI